MDQKVATVAGGTAPVPSLLHRERSVHQILGGGKFADVMLWKQKRKSIGILGGSTLVWFVFEWSGYTLISLVANIVLFLLIALFAWANLAALVNRPLPPVPEVQLSDEKSNKIAKRVAKEVNGVLNYARSLSTGKDFPMLLKVITCLMLWVLGNVGQWFSLLTLIYLGVIGTLTLPLAYERHEDQIDQFIQKIVQKARNQYHKLDECCLSKLPQCCKN
ncbi:hypothetical protein SELMODRAFT_96839 [Selaginella moellendorffii]|uniref:Reticulon-like protein n=1 Tax=Selaginella moellendorffii TaxID=88036 RepID=D8RM49_SELML|nr:hypothetical protein SELMODRAFT_96839 [Selaginella moellendorffii]